MRKVYSQRSAMLIPSHMPADAQQLEINQITRRRTALETSLIRQKTRKEDYFNYAEYEINLERLRKVRWKRLGEQHSLSPVL